MFIKRVYTSIIFLMLLMGVSGCHKENSTDTMIETESENTTSFFESETMMQEISSETEIITESNENVWIEPIIIVLDPGHDSEFCSRNHPALGVNEQDLNLEIALACKDELEKYEGVEVYMTREDGSCPDAEHGGEYCIEARTGIGTELHADLFVSLHNNGTTGQLNHNAGGAEVYVSNYSAYTETCKVLGEMILEELELTGIEKKGVFVRTKEEKGHYDDGTIQDWYYLISYSVEGGHPGIIIEHAYMDNYHDNEILKKQENLVAMGKADATALARYYQLELKPEF